MKRTDAEKYRFPIFRERFRELQGNMSNTEFAEFLDISRQTVGFYCNGERIPDALGLKKIAEKCNVSADWLIGLSDIKSIDQDVKVACEYTGLTEEAVETLRSFTNINENLKNRTIKRIRWIINEIVPSNDFFHLLRTISCYIDVFSGVSSHLSKENDYNGDYHEIDGLSFCDADILNLRRDYATEQLESLLINTAIAAERQKEKPEVFTKEEKRAWLDKNTDVALGSDAFFPFPDNIERAHKSGVKYIAQPGGSVRDEAVIECCDKYDIAMAFTGIRLFHH